MRLELLLATLENLPNPVLIKDSDLRYVWVNPAFEQLFGKTRAELLDNVDADVFVDRQAAQCNGGDLRVLETGDVDHADETIVGHDGSERDIITRKSRVILEDGDTYLIGVLHDVTQVSTLNRELEASREALAELSRTDPLTGVSNRRGLTDATTTQPHDSAAVVVFDIDHFKQINDEFGHDTGDDALRHIASLTAARLEDHQHLARLGGEEFAIYLPDTSIDETMSKAESIRSALEESPLIVGSATITLTASFGVAASAPADLSELLKHADRAMYQAKEAGRNRVIASDAGVLASA